MAESAEAENSSLKRGAAEEDDDDDGEEGFEDDEDEMTGPFVPGKFVKLSGHVDRGYTNFTDMQVSYCEAQNTLEVVMPGTIFQLRIPLSKPENIVGTIDLGLLGEAIPSTVMHPTYAGVVTVPTLSLSLAGLPDRGYLARLDNEIKLKMSKERSRDAEEAMFVVTTHTRNRIRIDSARSYPFYLIIENAHFGNRVVRVLDFHYMPSRLSQLDARSADNLAYAMSQTLGRVSLDDAVTYVALHHGWENVLRSASRLYPNIAERPELLGRLMDVESSLVPPTMRMYRRTMLRNRVDTIALCLDRLGIPVELRDIILQAYLDMNGPGQGCCECEEPVTRMAAPCSHPICDSCITLFNRVCPKCHARVSRFVAIK